MNRKPFRKKDKIKKKGLVAGTDGDEGYRETTFRSLCKVGLFLTN